MLNTSRDSRFFKILSTLVAWRGDRKDDKLGYLIVLHVDVTVMYILSVLILGEIHFSGNAQSVSHGPLALAGHEALAWSDV